MNAQAYHNLQKKHREELNDFPIAYAFDPKGFKEALEKLGATADECVTVFNMGDVMKKTDVKRFKEMLRRHRDEILELISDEKEAEEAFLYEMDNHEYAINWDGDDDVLGVFDLTFDKLNEMGLKMAYMRARKRHMQHARDWEMI